MAKSIRLNVSIRAEISAAIRLAYKEKNPAPDFMTNEEINASRNTMLRALFMDRIKKDLDKVNNAVRRGTIPMSAVKKACSFKVCLPSGSFGSVYCHSDDSDDVKNFIPQVWDTKGVFFDMRETFKEGDKETFIPLKDAPLKAVETHVKSLLKGRKAGKDEHAKWSLRFKNYMSDVDNVLAGVNTTGQLLEVWPECEKFIPSGLVDPSKISLPSVNLAALNAGI